MTTVATAPSASSTTAVDPLMMMMMEETTNDMEMDDMSIQSFCDGKDNNEDCDEECEEIVDLLLNPFDEEDDVNNNIMTTTNADGDGNDTMMMMENNNGDSQQQFSSLRQVSEGSKSTTVPDALVVSSNENALKSPTPSDLALTNRLPVQLYLSCNPDHLNEYQVEIRKMVQLFEATPPYVEGQRVKGRNRAIVLGQVGVQCSFCGHVLPPQNRAKGSTYFPQKLAGIYQACQILSTTHLLDACPNIPQPMRERLSEKQKTSKASRTAGKDYWASTAEALGVYEDDHGLRFEKRIPTYDEMKAKERARGYAREEGNFKY